ncbi:MAG: ABC transporter ATP-binding protein [Gammaproteobacteria bacterium]
MSAAIEFSNVSLEYGLGNELIKVLKCISFSVNSDETVSIVGPSGSGKTSIIMLAAGLEKSTEGSIKVHNQEITNLKENDLSQIRRQNIGIVFQSFYLIPNLTAIENVLLSLEANQKYNLDNVAKELLGEFGLSHRINHLPSELSGGEQQRVAIARALINKPKIILADEPTGNLDGENSQIMMKLLLDYTKKSKTSLVLVTHDTSLAQRCDRIIELNDGNIA